MDTDKSRRWCVTMWDAEKVQAIKKHLIEFGLFGEEYAPTTGKLHYQGYIEFYKSYTMGSVKRVLCDKTAHVEPAVAHRNLCVTYCKKAGNIVWNVDKHYIAPIDPNNIFDVFDIPEDIRGNYDGH